MAKHVLESLPYPYDALEPYIDEQTMRIHHGKHHQAYVNNLNAAIEGHPDLQKLPIEELIRNIDSVPSEIRQAVRNHGGGHLNHRFFWPILKKDVPLTGEIDRAITSTFGSHDEFNKIFAQAAAGQFGSGWAWLVLDGGKLEVMSTANQDSPLSIGKIPLITIDIWEHAYYLKYQNRRPEFIFAWWQLVDWDRVGQRYLQGLQELRGPQAGAQPLR